jgi:RNA 2',3'-cyclic 3'-phosphodiesterase
MIRTFIAVDVSPEVKSRATEVVDQCRRLGIEAKWVAVENMHITLQFLGNVRENELPGICRRVERAIRQFPAFDVMCERLGAFPNPERPRVLWMGMSQGREELIRLQHQVEETMRPLGFRGEARRFEPHLTLGRLHAEVSGSAEVADFIARNQDLATASFDVSEVVVYSSERAPGGPRYEVVGRAELAG